MDKVSKMTIVNDRCALMWRVAIIGIGVAIAIGVPWMAYSVHRGDDALRAACVAKGGALVEAREPLHVCVKSA